MSPGKSRSARSGVALARIALTMSAASRSQRARPPGSLAGGAADRSLLVPRSAWLTSAAGRIVSRVISRTASSRNSAGTGNSPAITAASCAALSRSSANSVVRGMNIASRMHARL